MSSSPDKGPRKHSLSDDDICVEQVDVARLPAADLPTRLAEDASYGSSAIRGIISSPYVFGAAMVASLGGFSFGYDQGVISIINVMDSFHAAFPEAESGFGKGFMTGMLELGAFLGCFFMPWLADKISRKRALIVVVVIFDIGAIIQTAARNYGMLVAGRAIGGIGVGTLALVRILRAVLSSKRCSRFTSLPRAHPCTSLKSLLLISVVRFLFSSPCRLLLVLLYLSGSPMELAPWRVRCHFGSP